MIREEHYVCTDINRNNNKFWNVRQDGNSVTTTYGRVGQKGSSKTWSFANDSIASSFFEKKKKEKLRVKTGRDAYTKIEVLGGSSGTTEVVSDAGSVAERDISPDSEITKDLIRYLGRVNVHQITSSTAITYNAAEGVFKTPLGVVGQSSIDNARNLLTQIKTYVDESRLDDPTLIKLVNHYLRYIPQDLGGTQTKIGIRNVFGDSAAVSHQADIIDSLEASIAKVVARPADESGAGGKRVFNVVLRTVEDQQVLGEVEKLFSATRQSIHTSSVYSFKRVYSLDIVSMREAYEKHGGKLDNQWRLWHGTKPSNVLSILKSGLIVPTHYTNGWAFGAGVYFSDQSTKSLNYSSGHWSGQAGDNRIFMFLADVAMGRYYIPKNTYDKPFPKPGYDSTFARISGPGGPEKTGGLMNNEMIVHSPSQCNLVYLVEFER